MQLQSSLPKVLLVVGFVGMLIGAIDPLEGSVVILAGMAVATAGAFLVRSRYLRLFYRALGLAALGVAIMFVFSAVGGIGGNTGRSLWLAVFLLPYPVGWIMGVVAAILSLREFRRPQQPVAG